MDVSEEQLNLALDGFRATVTNLVAKVNEATETGCLGAGAALQKIVLEARGFIEETEATMSVIDDAGDRVSVTHAIEEQSRLISEFVRDLGDRMDSQDQVATEAEATLKDITEAGATIDRITRESRMLALNALIETHRLGQDGRSLAVIADHMKQLSQTVADANEKIDVLSEHLLRILPQLAEQARSMRERCTDFSDTIEGQIEVVSATTNELRQAISEVRRLGGERLDTIVSASHSALGHLAFQDPVAQQLQQLENEVGGLGGRIRNPHGVVEAEAVEVAVSAEQQDDSGIDAGELLLF
ncbi:MAG: methyl-accepting chemotaxis protein [Myxococcota bacterium]